MTVLETLKDTREQIATEDRWCKGHLALDKDGNRVPCKADNAHRWNIHGAIVAVEENGIIGAETEKYLEEYAVGAFEMWVAKFNDHPDTTHQDVIRFLDRAIKKYLFDQAEKENKTNDDAKQKADHAEEIRKAQNELIRSGIIFSWLKE